jgi:hypothetical protein
MAGTGGRRPGAGRKPKAFKRIVNETPIQVAEGKIRDRLPWLVDKMLELAEGVYEERSVAEGVQIVYKQPPDRQAIAYLIDRVMGKASQPVEIIGAIRDWARSSGVDEDAAVAEAEQYLKDLRHAGARG